MFRARREQPTGEDLWLIPKMVLFVSGALLGIGGMATGRDWPVTAGIVLLLMGFVMRFATRRVNPPGPSGDTPKPD